MNLDAALQTYVAESREMLQEMEDALLRLEQEDDKSELLNAIFRAAHTIKGSAGLFGLDDIVAFTHGVETLLDKLRAGELAVTDANIALFLACGDHIGDLIDHVESRGESLPAAIAARGAELTEQLGRADTKQGAATELVAAQPAAAEVEREGAGGGNAANENWHISLRFGIDSLRDGMDPLSFVRYLGTIGEIVAVTVVDDAMPDVEAMDPESCYLGFEIDLRSDADKGTIESVFDFIREESIVRILPPGSRISEYIELIQELPEEDMFLGEILVRSGSLTRKELDEALAMQSTRVETGAAAQPLGAIVVGEGMTSQPVLNSAVAKQASVREGKAREAQSVRVDADKLDHLINLVGELVIAGAGTSLEAAATGNSVLLESMSTLTRLTEEVRDAALRLRMVQIGVTFSRFQRIVRDVSRELDKDIRLEISGADTELDKTVVEKIGDPLMHLVRNAIDHGIEPTPVRIAAGKPATGTVRLNAYHDSGSVVIEVSDDGGGLDRSRILQKARERGLVDAEQVLDDDAIFKLIFEPGFSTAEQISNLSGRGVGMDVVKRNITELRGSVDVSSVQGEGTLFKVRLPLTLAIIDGFLIAVENSAFVVPLDMVLECVELDGTGQASRNNGNYINLRGEVLPYIRLRDMFEIGGCPPRRENIVVVNYAGTKAGLVVDELRGEFQTVIKPLGQIFHHLQGISGSTILGTGDVALIVDVPGLVQRMSASVVPEAKVPA